MNAPTPPRLALIPALPPAQVAALRSLLASTRLAVDLLPEGVDPVERVLHGDVDLLVVQADTQGLAVSQRVRARPDLDRVPVVVIDGYCGSVRFVEHWFSPLRADLYLGVPLDEELLTSWLSERFPARPLAASPTADPGPAADTPLDQASLFEDDPAPATASQPHDEDPRVQELAEQFQAMQTQLLVARRELAEARCSIAQGDTEAARVAGVEAVEREARRRAELALEEVKRELVDARLLAARATAEAEAAIGEAESALVDLTSVKAELVSARGAAQQARDACARLTAEFSARGAVAGGSEGARVAAAEEVAAAVARSEALSAELGQLRERAVDLAVELQEARELLGEARARVRQAEAEAGTARELLGEARAQACQAEAEAGTARERAAVAGTAVEALEVRLGQRSEELSAAYAELAAQRALLDERERALSDAAGSLEVERVGAGAARAEALAEAARADEAVRVAAGLAEEAEFSRQIAMEAVADAERGRAEARDAVLRAEAAVANAAAAVHGAAIAREEADRALSDAAAAREEAAAARADLEAALSAAEAAQAASADVEREREGLAQRCGRLELALAELRLEAETQRRAAEVERAAAVSARVEASAAGSRVGVVERRLEEERQRAEGLDLALAEARRAAGAAAEEAESLRERIMDAVTAAEQLGAENRQVRDENEGLMVRLGDLAAELVAVREALGAEHLRSADAEVARGEAESARADAEARAAAAESARSEAESARADAEARAAAAESARADAESARADAEARAVAAGEDSAGGRAGLLRDLATAQARALAAERVQADLAAVGARADEAEQRATALAADLDQARNDLAQAFTALRTEAIHAREAQTAAEQDLADALARIEALECARAEAALAAVDVSGLHREIEQQRAQIALLEGMVEATRDHEDTPRAGYAGAEVPEGLGTFRAIVLANLDHARQDADAWKSAEVAIGRSIKELLALAHRLPQHLDEVYRVLGAIQDVLDTGKKLVRRNQQRGEEEVQALGELEESLGVAPEAGAP